jgi:hypothetical protein
MSFKAWSIDAHKHGLGACSLQQRRFRVLKLKLHKGPGCLRRHYHLQLCSSLQPGALGSGSATGNTTCGACGRRLHHFRDHSVICVRVEQGYSG